MKRFLSLPPFNLFYWITFLTLFALFFVLAVELDTKNISFIFKFFSAVSESAFWMIFLVLLKGRWKIISLIIPFILAVIIFANVEFFRNFKDIIPPSSYFEFNNFNIEVGKAAVSSFRGIDLFVLLLPFIPLASLFLPFSHDLSLSQRKFYSIGFLSIFLFSYAFVWIGSYRRIGIYSNTEKFSEIMENLYPEYSTNWKFYYDQHTFNGYLLKCLIDDSGKTKELSEKDIEYIRDTFKEKSSRKEILSQDVILSSPREFLDSCNLIMIVVESLPYTVVENDVLKTFAPNIAGLTADTANIIAKLKVLADKGRSSDAQFIYNTGLLPLRESPLVNNFSRKPYPSLAKALQYNSLELIGENKNMWSHASTSASYGFGELVDRLAITGLDQDSIIFSNAASRAANLPQPFFIFISTLSMHDPYTESRVSSKIDSFPAIVNDLRDREFLTRLAHFDTSLKTFFTLLKQEGIYDNSVIVILGDHEINPYHVSGLLHDEYVPMLILNSPVKTKTRETGTQLDVFPSILDLFGIDYYFMGVPYRGLGQSIFLEYDSTAELEAPEYNYPSEKDYLVSEKIIKASNLPR